MPLPLAPLFVASQLLITVADSVPQLNVRTSCSAANRGGGASQDMNNCLQEEQIARTQLVKDWGEFAAGDRSSCVQLSTMGGSPSYVELLTCLEMAKQAKELPEDTMLQAVMFGHKAYQEVIDAIIDLAEQAAREPWELKGEDPLEGEIDASIALNFPGPREVADSGVEQHDSRHRQVDGGLEVLLGFTRCEEFVYPNTSPDAQRRCHRSHQQPLACHESSSWRCSDRADRRRAVPPAGSYHDRAQRNDHELGGCYVPSRQRVGWTFKGPPTASGTAETPGHV